MKIEFRCVSTVLGLEPSPSSPALLAPGGRLALTCCGVSDLPGTCLTCVRNDLSQISPECTKDRRFSP